MKYLSQTSFFDKPFRKRDRGYAPVVKPNQIWDIVGRFGHGLGFLQGDGQGLFTEHNFAGLRSRNRDRCVQNVRCGDIDDLNVRPADDLLPICFYFFPSPLRSHRFQLGAVASANYFQTKLVRRIEKMSYLLESVGMSTAHEAVADHGNVQFLLGDWHGVLGDLPETRYRREAGCKSL